MTAAPQWHRPGLPQRLPQRVTSPVLVGRGRELAWLDEALARVRGGSPAALLVGGHAGIGKSRLISEFGSAAAAVACVLNGRCPELGTVGLPFAPFAAVLRDLIRARVFTDVIGSPDRELIRLLPELGEPAATGTPREARSRLFVEMLSLLEQLGRQRPTVLVIEDAHWADESTRDLMYFLIDNQEAMPGVLIIVTFRSCELRRGHPLCALLPRLGRLGWVQRTDLPELSRDESAELVGHLLGHAPGLPLADRLHRRAEGNPLFIEELASSDGDRGGSTASTHDLMLAAIRRLPEQTQEVLRVASAGGQRTGRGLLAAVTGMDPGALEASVHPALDSGVLEAGEDSFAFRHALISEALHHDLLPGEHTAVHQRFAVALREDSSLVPAGCAAFEEAEHWQHTHDPTRALSSAWRAAADAGRALAQAEQLVMLTRVLELWQSVPNPEWLTGAGHALVLRQAAEVATAAGERQLGTALATAARDEAGAYPETGRTAPLVRS